MLFKQRPLSCCKSLTKKTFGIAIPNIHAPTSCIYKTQIARKQQMYVCAGRTPNPESRNQNEPLDAA